MILDVLGIGYVCYVAYNSQNVSASIYYGIIGVAALITLGVYKTILAHLEKLVTQNEQILAASQKAAKMASYSPNSLSKVPEMNARTGQWTCPHCNEINSMQTWVCGHCGYDR